MTDDILVTGATGQIARQVVTGLLEAGTRVRALSRDADRARRVLGPDVEVVAGDWAARPDLLTRAAAGVDRVFLALGTAPDQAALEMRLVDAVAAGGNPHVVKLSTIGADLPDERLGGYQVARWHAAVESHLARTGLRTVVLRPAAFVTNLLALAPGVREGVVATSTGDGRVSLVDPRDVAEVAVARLTGPDDETGAHLLTGPEALSYRDIAELFGDVLGTGVEHRDIDDDTARAALLAAGLPDWLAEVYVEGNVLTRRHEFGEVAPDHLRALTGRPRRGVRNWIEENRAAFTGGTAGRG